MALSEHDQLMHDVNAFCEEIRPHEDLCYLEHKFNDQLLPLAKKYNILGMPVPKALGGRGASAVSYLRALARIGREGTGVRTFFSGQTSIGQAPILAWGNDDQKQRYLPASCRGEKILAFGLTEPEAGSNPLEMTSTYQREGDHYLLNGVKYLISNGGIADAIVTFAYPHDKKEGGRISAFIIDTRQSGFQAENLDAKCGMYASNTAMFQMDNLKVPLNNMLGEEGNGFRIAMWSLVTGRLSVAAGCLGVIEDCLAEALHYAKERQQHGKPIAKHQLIQDHIARIEMCRLASDAVLMLAAQAKDDCDAHPADQALRAKADLLAAQAKYQASNAAWEAADRAVQVFGGRGWSTLYRPGRHINDVRVCRIYEGTDEIIKLKIASALLGKGYEAFK